MARAAGGGGHGATLLSARRPWCGGALRRDSTETLQGYLTEWAEIIPATFDVLPLVDRAHQRRLIGDQDQAD